MKNNNYRLKMTVGKGQVAGSWTGKGLLTEDMKSVDSLTEHQREQVSLNCGKGQPESHEHIFKAS